MKKKEKHSFGLVDDYFLWPAVLYDDGYVG